MYLKPKIDQIREKLNLTDISELEIESRNRKDCGNSSGDPCFGPYSYQTTVEYQGCTFNVVGQISICFNIQTGEIYYSTNEVNGNFPSNWFDGGACQALLYNWVGLWLWGEEEVYQQEIDTWQYAMEQGFELNFVQDIILNDQSNSYFCDQPEIDGNILVENYVGTCYRRCTNYNQETGLDIQSLRCGFGCCKKTTKYCVDRKTGELESSYSLEVIKECNYDPEEYPGCDNLGDCRQHCAR